MSPTTRSGAAVAWPRPTCYVMYDHRRRARGQRGVRASLTSILIFFSCAVVVSERLEEKVQMCEIRLKMSSLLWSE